MDSETFEKLMNADRESEHLEFKEAKAQFSLEEGRKSLFGYYVALANEKGGRLVLGVTNKIPREVVGTDSFKDIGKVKEKIYEKFHRTIEVEEVFYKDKRALVFTIPSRPIGEAIDLDGKFLMREGESLVTMSPDVIKKINQESVRDYSGEICDEANIDDLDKENISILRTLLKQSKRVDKKINTYSDKELLSDLGLIYKGKVTNAAIILLGKISSVKKFFPDSEIRFQYKEDKNKVRADSFEIFNGGYLGYYHNLWELINLRNKNILLQVGLRVLKKQIIDEETIREAINNAVIHRDYTEIGSTIITQSTNSIMIESPGGLLPGVTIENIANETKVRNKLLAEVLSKCDFVESFGNGVDLMIQHQLSMGKKMPNYSKTHKHKVVLEIDGVVYDPRFAGYVSRVAYEKNKELSYKELIVLMKIKEGKNVESNDLTKELLGLGLIEKIGNRRYILSKRYYVAVGKSGEYTRRRGLDKHRNKELILEHLKIHKRGMMGEFIEIFSGEIPRSSIANWVGELKKEGKIKFVGNPQAVRGDKKGYWILTD
jgi:ATP-dependent DNA helicase RecG